MLGIARPALIVAFALVACSKSSSSSEADAAAGTITGRTWSCDRASAVGTCSEYGHAYVTQNEVLVKSSCSRLGGTLVEAECPNTSIVGACTLSSGEIRKYYGTGASAYDPERARAECASVFQGTWK